MAVVAAAPVVEGVAPAERARAAVQEAEAAEPPLARRAEAERAAVDSPADLACTALQAGAERRQRLAMKRRGTKTILTGGNETPVIGAEKGTEEHEGLVSEQEQGSGGE